MAAHREIEEPPGHRELRRSIASRELATGTLACPGCDAPVLPRAGGMSPADALSCSFCRHTGQVRDFLSLGQPTRPTHVVVRVCEPVRRAIKGTLPANQETGHGYGH